MRGLDIITQIHKHTYLGLAFLNYKLLIELYSNYKLLIEAEEESRSE